VLSACVVPVAAGRRLPWVGFMPRRLDRECAANPGVRASDEECVVTPLLYRSIRFTCACSRRLGVPWSLRGRFVRCPACGAVVRAEPAPYASRLIDSRRVIHLRRHPFPRPSTCASAAWVAYALSFASFAALFAL
jgi:hypothetical protein